MPNDSDPANFTVGGARRIVEMTRRMEALEINVKTLQRMLTQRLAPILPTIGFPQADIAPNATGTFKRGFGVAGSEAELSSDKTFTVVNSTGSTVWAGSLCIMAWLMVEQSDGGEWHIIQSNSARTVKATVNEGSGVGTGDATYDVDSVTAQSGSFFAPTSITDVKNTHGWAIDDDAVVQLVYNETEDAWDTVNVNCPA